MKSLALWCRFLWSMTVGTRSVDKGGGTHCVIPANNAQNTANMRCNYAGKHVNFCTSDLTPRSYTTLLYPWISCAGSPSETCPATDMVCRGSGTTMTYQVSGAGSPGCGSVTRCTTSYTN